MKERIYVCHTYYHAYISFLKELALPLEEQGKAALVLSTMSNNFEDFADRVASTGLFAAVHKMEEKRDDFFPELARYKTDKGNFLANLWQRIVFTRKYAALEAPYMTIPFREYKDIYVYCDADPIGYYLNQNKIYYHAVEDGLNCLKYIDTARYANRGHFGLKAFLSKRLNLIFVQNGYGKYCLDMEVNDISAIKHPCPYYIERPRKALIDRLSERDKDLILQAFVRDKETLQAQIAKSNGAAGEEKQNKILILTDPLCTFDVREQIFRDIIQMYEAEGQIFLKPHPRDLLDYKTLFGDYPQFDATVPMELLGYFPDLHFQKVVGVLTEVKDLPFADECIRLGADFMDKYEDPAIHRQNEMI